MGSLARALVLFVVLLLGVMGGAWVTGTAGLAAFVLVALLGAVFVGWMIL
jgi:hypothetical protein